jgi:hypothetical protein
LTRQKYAILCLIIGPMAVLPLPRKIESSSPCVVVKNIDARISQRNQSGNQLLAVASGLIT